MKSVLDDIVKIINGHQTFVLTTHVNPDGDGLGTELALAYFLRKLGKTASIFNHSATPENYRWLDDEKIICEFRLQRDEGAIQHAEVIFVLDTNQPDRLRSLESSVLQSGAIKIVIDHHLEPRPFADHYLVDDDATSTAEIVYRLLIALNGKLIDGRIARALYTAVMTDTGSFRYPRTDRDTHEIAADLLSYGVDPTDIYEKVYENWSPGRMKLLGEALGSMKTAHGGKLAFIICTQRMFKQTGTTEIETDNFTVYPMSVGGVILGILFNELEDGVKISFRSKGSLPVNRLAKEFGGNGHLNAAGARLFNVNLQQTIEMVLQKAAEYLRT